MLLIKQEKREFFRLPLWLLVHSNLSMCRIMQKFLNTCAVLSSNCTRIVSSCPFLRALIAFTFFLLSVNVHIRFMLWS